MADFKFDDVDKSLEDIRLGKMVIVVDDEDRENEGDFICAAELMTPEKVNFMATHGRGLICVAIPEERCEALQLDLMVGGNTSTNQTAFTVSVDLLGAGCTTGISASDRSKTILALADRNTRAEALGRPGHIFPLMAKGRGVLRRAGHTEAAVDLARLAGMEPAGVLVEIMNEDGTMARLDDLISVAKEQQIKIISIKDLIAYRLQKESLVEKGEQVNMPTQWGSFNLIPFLQKSTKQEHVALIKGAWTEDDDVLVRVHSSCATGDIFGSMRCECGEQLHKSMEMIEKEGRGVLVYMNQEGRGIGLMNKIKAYKLQEQGLDTVEANIHLGFDSDERDYGVGAQILRELGVRKMRLMTNNPIKRIGMQAYGLEVVENVALEIKPNQHNAFYMKTKRDRMGHDLNVFDYEQKDTE